MANRSPMASDIVLTTTSVALALATAYIHSTVGGVLFTLNAIGYLAWAVALVVPIAIVARHRWLVRIGLAGYAATTIAAWLLQPTYYSTAYLAKAIELALIAVLAVGFARPRRGAGVRFRPPRRQPGRAGSRRGAIVAHPTARSGLREGLSDEHGPGCVEPPVAGRTCPAAGRIVQPGPEVPANGGRAVGP